MVGTARKRAPLPTLRWSSTGMLPCPVSATQSI